MKSVEKTITWLGVLVGVALGNGVDVEVGLGVNVGGIGEGVSVEVGAGGGVTGAPHAVRRNGATITKFKTVENVSFIFCSL